MDTLIWHVLDTQETASRPHALPSHMVVCMSPPEWLANDQIVFKKHDNDNTAVHGVDGTNKHTLHTIIRAQRTHASTWLMPKQPRPYNTTHRTLLYADAVRSCTRHSLQKRAGHQQTRSTLPWHIRPSGLGLSYH